MRSKQSCFLVSLSVASVYSLSPPLKTKLQGIFQRPSDQVLACPVDKRPLQTETQIIGMMSRESRVSDQGIRYPVNSVYEDLLPSAARRSALTFEELRGELQDVWASRTQTGLFRSPFTAFLYERGWRQGFANAGFPGIEKEFTEVSEFFAPAAGGVVIDMSCGSGLMTRRLVKSGSYSRVLALDYSEAMLTETKRRFVEENVSMDDLTLCRADVAQLPIQSDSVDALHAGAALHCWPRLELGLSEIRRVLKPGGRFFATTFLQGAYGVPMAQQTGGGSFRFFDSTDELKGLLVDAGFPADSVDVRLEGRGCAIIKATLGVETTELES